MAVEEEHLFVSMQPMFSCDFVRKGKILSERDHYAVKLVGCTSNFSLAFYQMSSHLVLVSYCPLFCFGKYNAKLVR